MAVSDEDFQALAARVEELEHQRRTWVHLDRDVAALPAQREADRGLLQAIATTQSEHTRTLARQEQVLADHTARLERLATSLQKIIAILEPPAGTR